METTVKFEGIDVKIGGTKYVVPPLSLKQVRTLEAKINTAQEITGLPTEEQHNALVDVVHAAISRNYPDMTRDELEDSLDLANLRTVMLAVFSVSGFQPGEGAAESLLSGTASTAI